MAFCNGVYTGSNFARHESELTSYPGNSMRDNLKNRFYEGKQMTASKLVRLLALLMCLSTANVYRIGCQICYNLLR